MAKKAIRPIRIEGNVAYVPLTQGYETVIDAEDVHLVERWNWHAFIRPNRSGGFFPIYASRMSLIWDEALPRRRVYMHQVIMPTPSGMVVDHLSGDGLDNRRCNLRSATFSQNARNRRPREDGLAFGVSPSPNGKWSVSFSIGGFETYDAAVEARIRLGRFVDGDSYHQR